MSENDFAEMTEEAKVLCLSLIENTKRSIDVCSKFDEIDGMTRLRRRLGAELIYLESLMMQDTLSLSRVHSSNYAHLCSVTDLATKSLTDVVAVLKSFRLPDDKLTVDIVTKNSWVKVISRNPQSIHLIWAGRDGEKNIVDSIQDYFHGANCHRGSFEREGFSIVAHFSKGVTEPVANALKSIGAVVEGEVVEVDEKTKGFCVESPDGISDDFEDVDEFDEDEDTGPKKLIYDLSSLMLADFDDSRVNLDVTTMTSMISELTNGTEIPVFDTEFHEIQAAQERANRLLPIIKDFINDRKMIACKSAVDLMNSIVNRVGGPKEQQRFCELMKKIEVVEDDPSERAMALENSKKINERFEFAIEASRIPIRSKIIFGTGDKLRVVTVTSNSGFVRAAQLQEVRIATKVHEARCLTEQADTRGR